MSLRDRRFLQHAGVALDEEDVEEQIQGQRAKVYECSEQAPVLFLHSLSVTSISSKQEKEKNKPGFEQTQHGKNRIVERESGCGIAPADQ